MSKVDPAPAAMPILFDSSVSSWPAGFRGVVHDRHLLFVDHDFDVHLKISSAEGNKELYGQVIPREPRKNSQSSIVTLLVQGKPAEKTTTADFGEFSFREIPTGNLAIEVMMATRRIMAFFSV